MKKISKIDYPYKMICTGCRKTQAYFNIKPVKGDVLSAYNAINIDGTLPKAGEPCDQHCECLGSSHRTYLIIKR
jgi:hypothetical protein